MKTHTTLFLAAGLALCVLAGLIAPAALAGEGIWRSDWPNLSFMWRLGPDLLLSPSPQCDTSDEHTPVVVNNYVHKEYLVVWGNEWPSGKRDVYARRVSETGQVLSWFCVTTGTNNRLRPAVAYNHTDDEYLIVWMQEVSSNVYEIWGRIIPWNGPGTNVDFQIITYPNRNFWTPRVAWNSIHNEYLVVWNAMDTSGGTPGVPCDISSMLLSSTGGIITGRNLTTSTYPQQADITYNLAKNEYLVVFVRAYNTTPPATSNDVYGLRVSADNAVIGGVIPICTDLKHQNTPRVTTNEQDRYLVIWDHEFSVTDHDIYGQRLDVNGNKVGGVFGISTSTENDTHPAVAANGATNEWLAVWQRASTGGAQIQAYRWGSGVTSYVFEVAAWMGWDCMNPAVAADIPGYLIVYEANSPDPTIKQDIYGNQWWPEALYLPLVLRKK